MYESELFTPLALAVHATVGDFVDPRTGQRGAVALAPLLNIKPSTLSNRANPTVDGARMGLEESVPLQLVANDFQILYAYNAALGHCAYRLPENVHGSDIEILDAYLAVHEAAGRKAAAIAAGLRDGRISRREFDTIRRSFDDQVRAGLQLMAALERLA